MNKLSKAFIIMTVVCCALCMSGLAQTANENWISKLSSEDFNALQTYRMIDPSELKQYSSPKSGREFPEVWDWREMLGVTPVKNQAQCGSCWAFTAFGVIEAQILIETGIEYDLSEQQLVDCTPGSYGCNGGYTESAWSYLEWEPARIEIQYPYEAENGECRATTYPAYIRTTGYDAYNGSVEDIKTALMDYGPVATTMGANDNLKAYTGGCYADDTQTGINHGVVIVGWDDTVCEGGSWIVKNSWGEDFGENGFFYIRRGDVSLGDYFSQVYYEILPAVAFDLSSTNFNGQNEMEPQAGMSISAEFTVENIGRETAVNVDAVISTESILITIVSDMINLVDIGVGESVDVTDAFDILISDGAQPGQIVEFIITISSDSGESQIPVNLLIGPIFSFYVNDFEGDSDEGWTHGSTNADKWTRGMHGESDFPRFDPKQPYSGTHMWGLRLNKSGNYPANHNTWLDSPVYNCAGHTRIILRFKRWLSVEKGIFDKAFIKINDQTIWENQNARDLIDTGWKDIILDVTEYLDIEEKLRVSFGLVSDEGLEFGGWNIDDFQILSGMTENFHETFQDRMDVSLSMPDVEMDVEDVFTLYSEFRNYGSQRNILEFIALDVAGQFWFWPNWTEEVSNRERVISAESFGVETILNFIWPEVSGSAEEIRFWIVMLESNNAVLLDYDMIEWGW
ncbi:C1 family peptidase [bacterium]|nr:C1 family peptidase [bacterium]